MNSKLVAKINSMVQYRPMFIASAYGCCDEPTIASDGDWYEATVRLADMSAELKGEILKRFPHGNLFKISMDFNPNELKSMDIESFVRWQISSI